MQFWGVRKTSLVGFILAPLTAVILAGAFLLTLPAFSGAVIAAEKEGSTARCLPIRGEPANACDDLIELEVHDVIPIEEAGTHAVVMVSSDGSTLLPIFVDEGAAIAIAFRLAERDSPHPLPQDLLDNVVKGMGGKVSQVRIDDVQDDVYTGRVVISDQGKELALDARPSDSIAMALTQHARIFATQKVIDSAGITQEDLEQFEGEQPGVGGSGPPSPFEVPPGHPPVPTEPSVGEEDDSNSIKL